MNFENFTIRLMFKIFIPTYEIYTYLYGTYAKYILLSLLSLRILHI